MVFSQIIDFFGKYLKVQEFPSLMFIDHCFHVVLFWLRLAVCYVVRVPVSPVLSALLTMYAIQNKGRANSK